MEQLRIGLVGAGLIGSTHSIMLQQIAERWPERVQLVAVSDLNAENCRQFEERYGYRQSFARGEDLLAHADINVLFVCTPTKFHAEMVHAAAAAGLHLFCEKPLAMSHAEAAAMLAAVQRAGVKAQIGLVLRFSPVYTVMRDLLRDPAAGEPVAVIFRDDQCFPIRGLHHTAWRKDRTLSAGGTLIEHGVHDLDLLAWMFGPIRRLRAWQQNRAGHQGIEDYVAVEIEFASRLRAQLVNVWHDMAPRASNRRLEIFCQRAFYASDHDMYGEIEAQVGDAESQTLRAGDVFQRFETVLGRADATFRDLYAVPYFLQTLHFVEALLHDRSPAPGLEVGVETQRLAEAVYHAARTGDEVDLATFQL